MSTEATPARRRAFASAPNELAAGSAARQSAAMRGKRMVPGLYRRPRRARLCGRLQGRNGRGALREHLADGGAQVVEDDRLGEVAVEAGRLAVLDDRVVRVARNGDAPKV